MTLFCSNYVEQFMFTMKNDAKNHCEKPFQLFAINILKLSLKRKAITII